MKLRNPNGEIFEVADEQVEELTSPVHGFTRVEDDEFVTPGAADDITELDDGIERGGKTHAHDEDAAGVEEDRHRRTKRGRSPKTSHVVDVRDTPDLDVNKVSDVRPHDEPVEAERIERLPVENENGEHLGHEGDHHDEA